MRQNDSVYKKNKGAAEERQKVNTIFSAKFEFL